MCTRSGSLKDYLRRTYGEQVQKIVDIYGKELDRQARFSNHHHFNLRCHKSGVIPLSLRVKSPVDSNRARAAAARVSKVFLQERIKSSWNVRKSAQSHAEGCRKILHKALSLEDFSKIDGMCKKKAETVFVKVKENQIRKFDGLKGEIEKPEKKYVEEVRSSWVVNLSQRKLTTEEESVLRKGPKFAKPPRLNVIDFAAPIESALQVSEVSEQVKETVRIRICDAIKRAKKPSNNLTAQEKEALRILKEDKSIQILQADKGNATVLMEKEDYNKKVLQLLDDKKSYLILERDPTRTTERNLLTLLRKLNKDKKMSDAIYNRVRPSEGSSRCGLFYGRVKLHKVDIPLRPVIDTCGTVTYELSKQLSTILRPLVESSKRVLKNTDGLVNAMREVKLSDDEILISFDVKSLFTSVPVEEAINICERKLNEEEALHKHTSLSVETIVNLLRFCLKSTSFQYNGKYYKQLEGVAMGSPVSPIIADIFMIDLEDKTLEAIDACYRPRVWFRFVDDIISVVKKVNAQRVLDHLNNQNPSIVFTMEKEKDGILPFMDVKFTRQDKDGSLMREVYQKEAHTNRYIQFNSHQPKEVKEGVIACLMDRAKKVSSSEEVLCKEQKRVIKVMSANGYPRRFIEQVVRKQARNRKKMHLDEEDEVKWETAKIPYIEGVSQELRRIARLAGIRCVFTAPDTLRSLYAVKDPIPIGSQTHCVYSVKCSTCSDEYIGETKRAVDIRKKEHVKATRTGQTTKSAIAEHVYEKNEPHDIDWSSFKVIDRGRRTRERKLKEAFHIYKQQPKMNRDTGIERSSVWNSIL